MILNPDTSLPLGILIKGTALKERELIKHYLQPAIEQGLPAQGIYAHALQYNGKKAPTLKQCREYLQWISGEIKENGTQYLVVCDGTYFKALTYETKADPHYGSVLPAKLEGFKGLHVILCPNWQGLIYNPAVQAKIDLALNALVTHQLGTFQTLGHNIIHSEYYPDTLGDIKTTLANLHQYPALTVDIEAFSLRHYSSGVGTIGFSWDEHNGVAFKVDYQSNLLVENTGFYGKYVPNPERRALVRQFLTDYKGKLIFHNATYDAKVLIYVLWMRDVLDHVGLIEGLEVLEPKVHCTKLISYLATNNCNENSLSLKDLALEFAGNYAQSEIKDIRKIDGSVLLRYNLVDCLSTWYVHNKYYPIMVADEQESLYLGLFRESMITIIQMELTGMPMNMEEVLRGEVELQAIYDTNMKAIQASKFVQDTLYLSQEKWIQKDYQDRLEKAKNKAKIFPRDIDEMRANPTNASFPVEFNPNSGQQLANLLHDVIGLPVIERTPTKQPKTDDDTLKLLLNHTKDPLVIGLIDNVRTLLGVAKILSCFIPAFKEAYLAPDGWHYLFGSFNLGVVKSGRLSASDPNMQQIPSGSTYAKIIKRMFQAPPGWLFGGADYNALEDVVNTLLTKDPNKEKVLIEGYDGHCYRAYYFFPERLPGIVDTKESINSIKDLFGEVRQDAKAPAFALQYLGTWMTLVKNCGFAEPIAKQIETNFHTMYQVSRDWVEAKLSEASDKGYVTLAYGLRLRTHLLKKVVYGSATVPKEAAAEARTAGNAVSGQSYGLINSKAANEFMKRVRQSPYRYDIRICAQIHDAQYYRWPNSVEITKWVNDNLMECMTDRTDELPELHHPVIKLGAALDIYYPTWKDQLTIPNGANEDLIEEMAIAHIEKLEAKKQAA